MILNEVLVVDDSPTMRTLISFSLGQYAGVVITEAGNGVEALELMSDKRFDMLVVDINMPEMNGLELIAAVRQDPLLESVPIVVITTEGSDDDIKKGLQAGATEYLVKPFQPQKLHAVVDRLFGVEASRV